MTAVEGLVRHKYVTLEAPGVRLVPFLQDHYCVPHVAVRKVKLELGPIQMLVCRSVPPYFTLGNYIPRFSEEICRTR